MPNWKKVITSGSNAHLNQITASSISIDTLQNVSNINFSTGTTGDIDLSDGTIHLRATNNGSAGIELFGGTVGSAAPYIDTDVHSAFNLKVAGNDRMLVNSAGITINDDNGNFDFQIDGDENDNVFFLDAGTEKIGIGTNTPGEKLEVIGNISASGNAQVNQITASAFQFVGSGTAELEVQGNITASGNISASGTSHTFGGNIAIDTELQHIGDADTKIGFSDNVVSIKAGNNESNFRSTGFEQEGHITASGNISASGNGLGHTLGGRVSINYGNGGSMTGSLSNGEGFGEIVQFGHMDSTVTKGDVVIYRQNTHGWIQADKNTDYRTYSWMGVCIDPAADGATAITGAKILLKGVVRLGSGHIDDSGGNEGDPVYLQDLGHVTFAAPTAGGDFARIVGYVIDESQDIIYLDPDKTWIEIAT